MTKSAHWWSWSCDLGDMVILLKISWASIRLMIEWWSITYLDSVGWPYRSHSCCICWCHQVEYPPSDQTLYKVCLHLQYQMSEVTIFHLYTSRKYWIFEIVYEVIVRLTTDCTMTFPNSDIYSWKIFRPSAIQSCTRY